MGEYARGNISPEEAMVKLVGGISPEETLATVPREYQPRKN
jgi:hypothetical protein